MDLLGAYDSSSDSDDEGKVQQQNTNRSREQNATISLKGGVAPSHSTTTTMLERRETNKSKDKKRGKKILKLAAVLPEHIWNQLTAGNVGDGDSDNEDEDPVAANRETKMQSGKSMGNASKIEKPARRGNGSSNGKDTDLHNLLQELPKLKSVVTTESSAVLDYDDINNADSSLQDDGGSSNPQRESLGLAFLTSTVETTRRKRTSDHAVQDIHSPETTVTHTPPPQTIDSKTSSKASTSLPSQQHDLPRPTASRTVPLGSAAPLPMSRAGAMAAASSASRFQTPYTHDQQSTTTYAHSNVEPVRSSSGAASSVGGGKKRMSRKRQMEQMLRDGKIHEFEGDHELEGTANVYIPSDYDSGPSYQGHGVRVVPTSSYNVSAGATVASTEISGRQRNKHQLNSLLANAVSLEARRVQNAHLGRSAGGGSGTSHRASAKRKYGW